MDLCYFHSEKEKINAIENLHNSSEQTIVLILIFKFVVRNSRRLSICKNIMSILLSNIQHLKIGTYNYSNLIWIS